MAQTIGRFVRVHGHIQHVCGVGHCQRDSGHRRGRIHLWPETRSRSTMTSLVPKPQVKVRHDGESVRVKVKQTGYQRCKTCQVIHNGEYYRSIQKVEVKKLRHRSRLVLNTRSSFQSKIMEYNSVLLQRKNFPLQVQTSVNWSDIGVRTFVLNILAGMLNHSELKQPLGRRSAFHVKNWF